MSAFLGPIHNWLYNKVLFQNEMVETIKNLAEENQWLDSSVNLNRYGELEQGELADIVDPDNIHGWLQERVSLVENKLAYLVTVLTDDHIERIDDITHCMYELGKKHPLETVDYAKEAFDHMEALLLNGMPCDRVNAVVENSEEKVVWEQTREIHQQYWDLVGGDIEMFYAIRSSLIQGILEGSGFVFRETGDRVYEISK